MEAAAPPAEAAGLVQLGAVAGADEVQVAHLEQLGRRLARAWLGHRARKMNGTRKIRSSVPTMSRAIFMRSPNRTPEDVSFKASRTGRLQRPLRAAKGLQTRGCGTAVGQSWPRLAA